MGEVQWEAEFFALQDSNNKLAGALREANAAAAQWRQQLEAQRAEAERLRQRVRAPFPPRDTVWLWQLPRSSQDGRMTSDHPGAQFLAL